MIAVAEQGPQHTQPICCGIVLKLVCKLKVLIMETSFSPVLHAVVIT